MKKSLFCILIVFSCSIELFNPFIDTKASNQVLATDALVTVMSTVVPTLSITATSSPVATPTLGNSPSPTLTAVLTPTATAAPTLSAVETPTLSVSATVTPTATLTPTPTPSITATTTPTDSITPIMSPTPTPTSSAPLFTPTPPQGYIWCCSEDENMTFTEYVDVAYGAEGYYTYKYNQIGFIIFSNSWFDGDPIENVFKAGFYKAAGSTITPYTTPTPTPTPSSS